MKKKSFLALALACIMCLNFSTAMAASYSVAHENVSGGTVTTIGSISSPTMFYGKTTWTTGGSVDIYADVYTTSIDGQEVLVRSINEEGSGNCRVDQTHRYLPSVGTYTITKIVFSHAAYTLNSDMILDYSRTLRN